MPNNPTGASDADINAATQTGSIRITKSSDALGVASSDAEQSFGTLQTFSGGISAAGATFSGNISAPNIVKSFNGATGAVIFTNYIASFNGVTGAVTGITTGGTNVFTGLNTFSAGISLSNTFTISNNSPDTDLILACTNTSGNVSWKYPSAPVVMSGITKYLLPIAASTVVATATIAANGVITYLPFMIWSTCQVKPAWVTFTTAPTVTGNGLVKIYASSRTTGKPTGSALADLGSVPISNVLSSVYTGTTAATLSPGQYWVGVGYSAAINNLRRYTVDTANSTHSVGLNAPVTPTFNLGWSETTATGIPPTGVTTGSLTEVLSTSTTTPAIVLLVV